MSKLVAESGNPACRYLARHYNTLEKVRATLRRGFERDRHRRPSVLYFLREPRWLRMEFKAQVLNWGLSFRFRFYF